LEHHVPGDERWAEGWSSGEERKLAATGDSKTMKKLAFDLHMTATVDWTRLGSLALLQ
jgi:hypothetical protein